MTCRHHWLIPTTPDVEDPAIVYPIATGRCRNCRETKAFYLGEPPRKFGVTDTEGARRRAKR